MSDSFAIVASHPTVFIHSRGLCEGEGRRQACLHRSAGCRARDAAGPSREHLLGTSIPLVINNINIIFTKNDYQGIKCKKENMIITLKGAFVKENIHILEGSK